MTPPPSRDAPLVLTLKACAALLGISSRTLLRMVDRNEFPRPLRIGAQLRFERTALERYLDARRHDAARR